MKRKLLGMLLSVAMVATVFTGCGSKAADAPADDAQAEAPADDAAEETPADDAAAEVDEAETDNADDTESTTTEQ